MLYSMSHFKPKPPNIDETHIQSYFLVSVAVCWIWASFGEGGVVSGYRNILGLILVFTWGL
jgi:hypothetical protein